MFSLAYIILGIYYFIIVYIKSKTKRKSVNVSCILLLQIIAKSHKERHLTHCAWEMLSANGLNDKAHEQTLVTLLEGVCENEVETEEIKIKKYSLLN